MFAVIPTAVDVTAKADSCVAVAGCHVSRVGNGHCDAACNVTQCFFDGGTCVVPPHTLSHAHAHAAPGRAVVPPPPSKCQVCEPVRVWAVCSAGDCKLPPPTQQCPSSDPYLPCSGAGFCVEGPGGQHVCECFCLAGGADCSACPTSAGHGCPTPSPPAVAAPADPGFPTPSVRGMRFGRPRAAPQP
jgi:hypothetical protein